MKKKKKPRTNTWYGYKPRIEDSFREKQRKAEQKYKNKMFLCD